MEQTLSDLTVTGVLDRTVPALRVDLSFRPHVFGRKTYYIVEDPLSVRFYRIGLVEYTFMSLLDGRATLGEVLRATQAALPEREFTPADAVAIGQWVVRNGLAQDQSIGADEVAAHRSAGSTARRTGRRMSPLSVQLPLCYPDRLLERLCPWIGWCFSFPALLCWCFTIGWAVRDLITQGARLSAASSHVLAVGNWFWLAAAWVVLKVLHECGHAVACKRRGGEVREAGVIFILMAPLAYVDVTSTWRLRSKWARIEVAAAGMYVELLLAAVATLVWARVSPGVVSNVCFNIMTTASVMTVLFNANPLMRFDGYYILSDLLELPNLYARGQQSVARVVRRVLFGVAAQGLAARGWVGVFVPCYGLAAQVWRIVVFVGLVLTAATLLEGAGIVLSGLAVMLWGLSVVRRLARLARDPALNAARWARAATVAGSMTALLLAALAVFPWPGSVVAPAVICYEPETIVRTESDGFVEDIRVENAQFVQAGDVLAVLTNQELEQDRALLELAIKESQLKRRIHQQQQELAKAQAEEETLRVLESRLADKQQQVAQLVVRAPCAGQVIGRNLQALEGRYLERGSDLLAIGNEASKAVRMSIAQQDIDAFRTRVGSRLRAYLSGVPTLHAPLTKIEPRASAVPWDGALCANHGGTLPVRQADSTLQSAGQAQFEFLAPRFTASMPLDPADSARVWAGQRVLVSVHPCESVGRHLYHTLLTWADRKLCR